MILSRAILFLPHHLKSKNHAWNFRLSPIKLIGMHEKAKSDAPVCRELEIAAGKASNTALMA
jgi:hypothetical protein